MKRNLLFVITGIFLLFAVIQISCKKEDSPEKPTLTTLPVSEISETTAKSGGNITDDGGSEINSKGIVWDTISGPTVESFSGITMEGGGGGVFLSGLTNLNPATTYYVRAYATNSAGTAYGVQQMFTTKVPITTLPTVTTSLINSITDTTASGGGNVTSQGGSAILARGICWSTSPAPTIADSTTSNGTGTGTFTSSITGLIPATTYYVRAYATNSAGTAYGNEVVFATTGFLIGVPCPGMPTVTDYNGNVYNTVQIGTQCWMKENLKARNYRNGTTIPNISTNITWLQLVTGARCWYNNDSATYAATYGALYNWYAVDNPNGLCPTGWHVPTDAEWTILTDFLGGLSVAGGSLKETGTTHWHGYNTGATNSSGFTALPGGDRNSHNGWFSQVGGVGSWWSSSVYSSASARSLSLSCNTSIVNMSSYNNNYGFSVRCVRD